jgi:hypothetical protein
MISARSKPWSAKAKGPDFYAEELKERLAKGPVVFDLVAIMGNDPVFAVRSPAHIVSFTRRKSPSPSPSPSSGAAGSQESCRARTGARGRARASRS